MDKLTTGWTVVLVIFALLTFMYTKYKGIKSDLDASEYADNNMLQELLESFKPRNFFRIKSNQANANQCRAPIENIHDKLKKLDILTHDIYNHTENSNVTLSPNQPLLKPKLPLEKDATKTFSKKKNPTYTYNLRIPSPFRRDFISTQLIQHKYKGRNRRLKPSSSQQDTPVSNDCNARPSKHDGNRERDSTMSSPHKEKKKSRLDVMQPRATDQHCRKSTPLVAEERSSSSSSISSDDQVLKRKNKRKKCFLFNRTQTPNLSEGFQEPPSSHSNKDKHILQLNNEKIALFSEPISVSSSSSDGSICKPEIPLRRHSPPSRVYRQTERPPAYISKRLDPYVRKDKCRPQDSSTSRSRQPIMDMFQNDWDPTSCPTYMRGSKQIEAPRSSHFGRSQPKNHRNRRYKPDHYNRSTIESCNLEEYNRSSNFPRTSREFLYDLEPDQYDCEPRDRPYRKSSRNKKRQSSRYCVPIPPTQIPPSYGRKYRSQRNREPELPYRRKCEPEQVIRRNCEQGQEYTRDSQRRRERSPVNYDYDFPPRQNNRSPYRYEPISPRLYDPSPRRRIGCNPCPRYPAEFTSYDENQFYRPHSQLGHDEINSLSQKPEFGLHNFDPTTYSRRNSQYMEIPRGHPLDHTNSLGYISSPFNRQPEFRSSSPENRNPPPGFEFAYCKDYQNPPQSPPECVITPRCLNKSRCPPLSYEVNCPPDSCPSKTLLCPKSNVSPEIVSLTGSIRKRTSVTVCKTCHAARFDHSDDTSPCHAASDSSVGTKRNDNYQCRHKQNPSCCYYTLSRLGMPSVEGTPSYSTCSNTKSSLIFLTPTMNSFDLHLDDLKTMLKSSTATSGSKSQSKTATAHQATNDRRGESLSLKPAPALNLTSSLEIFDDTSQPVFQPMLPSSDKPFRRKKRVRTVYLKLPPNMLPTEVDVEKNLENESVRNPEQYLEVKLKCEAEDNVASAPDNTKVQPTLTDSNITISCVDI